MAFLFKILIFSSLLVACGFAENDYYIAHHRNGYHLLVGEDLVAKSKQGFEDVEGVHLDGQLIALEWREKGEEELKVSYFSSARWSEPRSASAALSFRFPLTNESSSSGQEGLQLLHLRTPLLPELRSWLEMKGVRVLRYLSGHGLLVDSTASDSSWQDSEAIHGVYPYQMNWKSQDSISTSHQRYLVMPSDEQDLQFLQDMVRNLGGLVYQKSQGGYLGVMLSPEQLSKLLTWPEVLWLEEDSNDIGLDMAVAREQGGANFLNSHVQSGGGDPRAYTGIGIKGHVLEGVDPSHVDLRANPFRSAPIGVDNLKISGHGHKTFGIIFASGEGDEEARGLLPNGQGFYTHYDELYRMPADKQVTGGRYELTERLIRDHGIHFQTASWGNETTDAYTLRSAELDKIIFDLDIPIMQSLSNSGNRLARPQAWAKSVVSVGGVYHFDSADPEDDRWDPGSYTKSSIGPAMDGRIKPDLVGYMDNTYTISLNNGYGQFGGTSGATPMVAGFMGLVVEMWQRGDLPGGSKATKPHASTLKALLLHGARQYSFDGPSSDLSRYHQGWGFPSLKSLFEKSQSMSIINESIPLAANESHSQHIYVDSGESLHVSLVYKDPPAVPMATKALVNDLDLRLTAPDGQIFWGNFGLRLGEESISGGVPDSIDVVEQVILTRPIGGLWQVEVLAREVNVDSHLETTQTDVDFALVVSKKDRGAKAAKKFFGR